MIPDLKHRYLIPEKMDAPDLDPASHAQALVGLRRINRLCNTPKHIASTILKIAANQGMKQISVLDLGCGSGDVAVAVQKKLNPEVNCHMTGWDMSEVAVSAAANSAGENSQIEFHKKNVFSIELPDRQFDFVYCCLFLHHFDREASICVMQEMQRLSRVAFIVDDLKRSRWGWLMAKVGCHALSRSPIVHFDGPQSVRAAYTIREIQALFVEAGLQASQLFSHWPERFQLVCERQIES